EWSAGELKLLLDYYSKYYPEIGPMKKFRTKKAMFEQIALDLQSVLGVSRTALQCDNRFKTLLKRKKNSQKVNRTSGSSRCTVEFEEEFARIRSMDDSLEPEVRRGVSSVIHKETGRTAAVAETDSPTSSAAVVEQMSPTSPPDQHRAETSAEARRRRRRANRVSSTTTRQQQMAEFFSQMRELQEQKEKNRERRHKEHLEVHKQHMELLTQVRDALQQNGSLL
ncbi:unnamed protein product, partial [Ixodes hexagonus]